jgi:hypothetical protein
MDMEELIGSLTQNYSAADVAAGKTPQAGQVYVDRQRNITYMFLCNKEAASAITEGVGCVTKTTAHRDAFGVIIGGAGEGDIFAGVRPDGADSLAAGEYGWFIVKGKATFQVSTATAATAVDLGAAGIVADAANDAAGAKGVFGTTGDAGTGGDCDVWIHRNIWGV